MKDYLNHAYENKSMTRRLGDNPTPAQIAPQTQRLHPAQTAPFPMLAVSISRGQFPDVNTTNTSHACPSLPIRKAWQNWASAPTEGLKAYACEKRCLLMKAPVRFILK